MSLPEWVHESIAVLGVDNDYEVTRLEEAITIAWEALERQGFAFDKATPDEFMDIAKDAMRRIAALGGDTNKESISELGKKCPCYEGAGLRHCDCKNNGGER